MIPLATCKNSPANSSSVSHNSKQGAITDPCPDVEDPLTVQLYSAHFYQGR
eukprot:c9863_g1_i1 orf=60-212(-)